MYIMPLFSTEPVNYYLSYLAPRLRGMKQKKLIAHRSSVMRFLLICSPEPRSQVRILIYMYQNWAITYLPESPIRLQFCMCNFYRAIGT